MLKVLTPRKCSLWISPSSSSTGWSLSNYPQWREGMISNHKNTKEWNTNSLIFVGWFTVAMRSLWIFAQLRILTPIPQWLWACPLSPECQWMWQSECSLKAGAQTGKNQRTKSIKDRILKSLTIFHFSGVAYLSKTTIKPVISRIRYFDTKLLNTDSIIVKVRKKSTRQLLDYSAKVTTRNDSDCLCSIISIQQPSCPFYDDIGSAMRWVSISRIPYGSTSIKIWKVEHYDGPRNYHYWPGGISKRVYSGPCCFCPRWHLRNNKVSDNLQGPLYLHSNL